MKNKKHLGMIILALFFVLYIIFAFIPLSTELQLQPEWTLDITQGMTVEQKKASSNLSVLPFKLGQNAGYFTHEGDLAYISNFAYKATISSKYLIPYERNSIRFDVYDSSGNIVSAINQGGFPYVVDDKVFVMLPGGSGFECIDLQGNVVCRFFHTSPITAFNSSKNLTVAGYADGKLCTFDKNMALQYTLEPGGSNTQVILGANASSQGNYFACVAGQDEQRFVLYKSEENHAKIVYHKFLDKSIIHQTLVYFSNDESTVYYNDSDGLGIVDTNNFKYSHIDIPGVILNIQESPVADSVFVLSLNKEGSRNVYTITILEQKSHKTGSFNFDANNAFILTDENSLFVGKDTKISKLLISKE